jgi:hypothetical protein
LACCNRSQTAGLGDEADRFRHELPESTAGNPSTFLGAVPILRQIRDLTRTLVENERTV